MKKTKILSLVLALALTVSMLAGCGGGETSVVGENEEVLKLEGALASADPLTLTLHLHFWGTNIFQDEWYWNAEAAKATNITLKGTASKASPDSAQEFNTMLVGDVLPDIIHGEGKDLLKAGRDGALIPLQDLVKKYAPNIQAAFDKFPNAYSSVVDTDGNLYYIPCIYDQEGPTKGWFVRQDWLDNLGLEQPKNIEEYYNVLKAFRENDPNGNGKKDEVPFFARSRTVADLVHFWDLSAGIFDSDAEGKVYAPATTEAYKSAIKELAKWYAEGLIDQEIFTRQNPREELFGNDIGGTTIDWFSSTMAFNKTMKGKVDGFNLAVMEPPVNANGNQNNYNTRNIIATAGWGISKDNKYVAETMKYFDYWFTQEGKDVKSMGIEGVHHYVDENGEKQYTEDVLSAPGGAPTVMREAGSCEIGGWMDVEAEIKGMTKEAAEGFRMYVDKQYQVAPFPNVSKTEEEQRIITEKEPAVSTFISEYLQNWIMGNKDVDATWDEYITSLNQLGIEDLIKVYQTAYDRVNK